MGNPGSHNLIGDVSRVLQMVTERSLRKFFSRNSVWIRDRTQRGVSHRGRVKLPSGLLSHRMRIVESQFHHEVVRMLAIDDLLSVSRFASLKKLGITAVRHCSGFQAEH